MKYNLTSKTYSPDLLAAFLGFVAENARARWPGASCLLTSDVAWRLPGSRPEKNLCLWYRGEEIAGYAWFEANGPCIIDQQSKKGWDPGLGHEMLAWLEARRLLIKPLVPWLIELEDMSQWEQALIDGLHMVEGVNRYLQVAVFDSDGDKREFLESRGYSSTVNFHYYLSRSLEGELPVSTLDSSWVLRHVLASDFEDRVAVHRASWVKSTYQLEQYLSLRDISVYDPELDIVAEKRDNEEGKGRFASYCIGWVDYETGVGSFEPVGTSPEYRQMGLGREVNFEGLRRMKAKGMHSAKIGTAGFNDRAYGLYRSCDFELVDRDRTYMKKLS